MKLETIVCDILEDVLGTRPKDGERDDFVTAFAAEFAVPLLPRPGETSAVAIFNAKTAALCYDRVWRLGAWDNLDERRAASDIIFHGTTRWEIELACSLTLSFMMGRFKRENPQDSAPDPARSIDRLTNLLDEGGIIGGDSIARTTSMYLRDEHQVTAVPMFHFARTRDEVYKPGAVSTLTTLLSNVSVVDEDALSWEQVHDFRRDTRSRANFRRLVHWLDREMVGKPLSYIEDEVGVRLDAYDRAMKAHGVRTVIGSLSALLEKDFLLAGTAVTSAAAAFGGGLAALVAGASVAIGQVSLHVANALLDAETARETAAGEIAFVVEAQKLCK